jgi:hypothetical protein
MKTLGTHAAVVSPAGDAGHSTHSSLRASILEHLFLGELLQTLWNARCRRIELLRAEVDAAGYDLLIECEGVARHVQLKSSHRRSKTRRVSVNDGIEGKPSGCVIWIKFDEETMKLGPYLWFGGPPNKKMPSLGDRIGQHTRRNIRKERSQRPRTRVLTKGSFTQLADMKAVVRQLFGNIAANSQAL